MCASRPVGPEGLRESEPEAFETILCDRRKGKRVQCHICQRRCVVSEGQRGYCETRVNREGHLYSLIYGRVSTIMVSPIEKKPLFHYYPGSQWLSLGSLGCNFKCPGCQNWDIAHAKPEKADRRTQYIPPGRLLQLAKENGCTGISWTYNEPTLWFEYTLDCAKLAKEGGMKTNYVTNGFITVEALDLIGPYLDSFRVDVKGFSEGSYRRIAHLERFEGILEATVRARAKWGMHVEVISNLIPGYNDDIKELKNIGGWIRRSLGKSTPWHVTRFVPHLELSHVPPTPLKVLETAREIGLREGLEYVYLGNVHGHPAENTYCPRCGNLLIQRGGFTVLRNDIADGRCIHCGFRIWGTFDS